MLSTATRRRAVLWRKGVRECARCGAPLTGPDDATLDHIVPKSAGGRTTRSNLTLSHAACNQDAGRILWHERKSVRDAQTPDNPVSSAILWYEKLLAATPCSRVPSPYEQGFQVIGAIEWSVTIAEGSAIRELQDLVKRYGKGSWLKRKGRAVVRLADGSIRRAELHWYEAHGIGRRDLKIKRYINL